MLTPIDDEPPVKGPERPTLTESDAMAGDAAASAKAIERIVDDFTIRLLSKELLYVSFAQLDAAHPPRLCQTIRR
jgi:hypothetical protein